MVAEVFAGIGAFKSMMDMAKAVRDMGVSTAVNSAVIDLQEKILAARDEYSTLLGSVGELEAKLASFENWESEKQRYELKPHGERQALAYALKEGVDTTEPAHSICPDCYQQKKKSILQKERRSAGRLELLVCQVCGWEGITHGIVVDSQPKVVARQYPGRKPFGAR